MAKVKMKYLGIPNVKRFYYGDGLSCDTQKKDTCIVEVGFEIAARLIVDFPKEWEYVTRKGEQVIAKEITEYSNKVIEMVSSTKGIVVVKENGKPKIVKKPKVAVKKPKEKK